MKIQTAIASLALLAATSLHAQVRVTEAMSSSGNGGTADWFEVTNYGLAAVDITGWKMDDNSFAFANSVNLLGITSIGAGQSVVFLETSTPDTSIPAFRTFWGTNANSISIGSYTGSGISFSSTADGVVLFNSTGTETTPRVTFGAATTGSSFYYSYDSSGNPSTSPNTNAIVSTVGLLDGQNTYTASDVLGNIGSPGTAATVPEPSTYALIALGVAFLLWRLRRKVA
jgi:hypothetical protein